jgi:hypothetical protein
MVTDWPTVRVNAISAAQGVLGTAWKAAAAGATGAIGSLVQTAQYIDQNKDNMTADEYQLLISQQKQAMQNVLTGYEAISIAAATNAIGAVINVIVAAAPTLLGLV